jgi:hypothetical protein
MKIISNIIITISIHSHLICPFGNSRHLPFPGHYQEHIILPHPFPQRSCVVVMFRNILSLIRNMVSSRCMSELLLVFPKKKGICCRSFFSIILYQKQNLWNGVFLKKAKMISVFGCSIFRPYYVSNSRAPKYV